jgi:FkbM family methyltransferase
MKNYVKHLIPLSIIKFALPIFLRRKGRTSGVYIKHTPDYIDVIKGNDVVRISTNHAIYLQDIIASFEYYFCAVIPYKFRDKNIVDYSSPRYHDVIGYDSYPILFPSLAEPLITTRQYMEFANLSEGMTVLDLGAYSGLTSIIFSQAMGETGTVIAVEADPVNIECIKRNIQNYEKHCANKILLLEGAIWKNNDGVEFSSEGNMGSSAKDIVGSNRGLVQKIPSFTLSTIAKVFNLSRVDFIKCDVEGAEKVIFSDKDFFVKFLPKIIIEPHIIDDIETTEVCIAELKAYGYKSKKIIQKGVHLPLIECTPP